MRKIAFLCSLLFLCGQLLAQTRTISGKILDEKGNPVPGASVQIKGSRGGTSTSTDGTFSISLPASAKRLVISSVNFVTQEIDITENMTVTLKAGAGSLDEVVVTAYGTTKKKAFTGTASVVNNDQFKDLQVSSITNVLQGNASGVLVVNSTGQPGENPDIRIRGIGSVNAGADPFIVLDGAPFGGSLSNINPNDIESITVLKDASSTALYGSRAANGILQITTKSGKGTPKVSISGVRGYSKRAVNDYKYVNNAQLYGLTWEALRNQANITPGLAASIGAASSEDYASQSVAGVLVYNPFGVAQPIGPDGKLVSGAKNLWSEDWGKDLIRTGQRTDINGSVSGGSDKTRYFISGGYLDDQGLPIQSDFKRYSARFKVDTKVNDWLNVGINASGSYSTQNYPIQGGAAYSNVTGWVRTVSGIYPEFVRDPGTGALILDAAGKKQFDYGNNGPLHRPILTPGNPAGTTAQNPTTYDRYVTSANAYGEAQIISGLKFRTQYAVDLFQNQYNSYYNPFVGDGAAYGGRSEKTRTNSVTQTFTNMFTYDNTFADIHHINVVAGMEAFRFHQGVVDAESRGFTFPGTTELAYGSTPYTANSYSYDNRMVSYFGRVNYDLGEKYHLSASLRRDGSSRFSDSARWGDNWSIGGAWSINKEDFMSGITLINDLKLRVSYGTTGNQAFLDNNGNVVYFPYLATYSAGANIAGYAGSLIANPANGRLTWEHQKTLDLGVDFAILKNRLSGSFTWFSRKSDKLLFNRPLPPSSGLDGVNDNIGTVTNKGIEIDLTSVNVKTRDFEWSTSVNFSKITNKITQLPQKSITGANYSNLIVGQPLNNFYIREYAGVDLTDGAPMWWMDQTDATTGKTTRVVTKQWSAATRYYKGTSLPDWIAGVTNTAKYKGFDLTVLLYINFRGKIYDANYASLMYSAVGNTPGSNWSVDVLNRWQSPSNPGDGKTPRLTTTTDDQANSASTRFLFDDTYMRIRNITLGYTFPKSIFGTAKINSARVYVDLQNPFTFYKYKGLDPEEGGLVGVTNNGSVVYKTFSAGLSVNF